MKTKVKLGAKRDGTLTAIEFRVVSNAGAYGGHGGETLGAALGSPLTAYRCPNKKADRLRGLHQHGAGRRLPRLRHVADHIRDRIRARRARAPARDRSDRIAPEEHDRPGRQDGIGLAGSVGCRFWQLRLRPMHRWSKKALASGRGSQTRRRRLGSKAAGVALPMLDCVPPTEHRSGAEVRCSPTDAIISRSARSRSATVGDGAAANRRAIMDCPSRRYRLLNADTDQTPYDTGTFASVGMMVPDKRCELPPSRCATISWRSQPDTPGGRRRRAASMTKPLSAATGACR